MIKNHLLKPIKNILIVDMATRSSVVMMINTADRLRFIVEKMLYIDLWNQYYMKLIGVKKTMNEHFNKPLKMTDEHEVSHTLS